MNQDLDKKDRTDVHSDERQAETMGAEEADALAEEISR